MTKEKGNELKVIIKAKELALHTFKLTSNSDRFPKKYRHSLCDRMQLKSLDIHDALLEANTINNVTAKQARCEMITKAITYCRELETYIEISMNLGVLKPNSAEYWSKLAGDVKHLAIAWRTQQSK